MPARASWKGVLRVNRLTVPIKAFTACSTESEIALHQLHRRCGERIRQQRVCPVHGVLSAEDIVSAYTVAEGRTVPLEADELESLLPNDDKAIEVDCFVPSNHIDAVHYSGRTYYLVPDDPPGQRPFCVLRDGLRLTDRHAVARVVMSRRQQLVLLRPLGKLVAMTVLEYPQRVRPVENYEGEVAPLSANAAEQELIRQLIDSMTIADLELSQYRDPYVERLSRLIERRLASTEPVDSAPSRAVADDDAALVAALRASLASDANGRSAAAPIGLNRMPLRSGDTEGGLARKLG